MAALSDPVSGLTVKQERFAQLVASGLSYSQAYRQAYSSSSPNPATVWQDSSTLASLPHVAFRIKQLRDEAQAILAEKRRWTLERLADEAEINLHGARAADQWGSANGALELVGRATGLLSSTGKAGESPVQVTKVVVVLDHGKRQQIVETTGYTLPSPVDDVTETRDTCTDA